ncbi:MAG: type II toxin-antitoxin system VapC family toxin, partial [Thermodesulfobacteriota bacterium]
MGKKKLISEKSLDLINNSEIFFSPIVKLELQLLHEIERLNYNADDIIINLQNNIGLKECK